MISRSTLGIAYLIHLGYTHFIVLTTPRLIYLFESSIETTSFTTLYAGSVVVGHAYPLGIYGRLPHLRHHQDDRDHQCAFECPLGCAPV